MTVRINYLLALLILPALISCERCESGDLYGRIDSPEATGTFTVHATGKDPSGKMEVQVSIDKKSIHATDGQQLISELQDSKNWQFAVNGKTQPAEYVFAELSNTMSPNLNVVLTMSQPPLTTDSVGSFNLSYSSSLVRFTAKADEQSIKCHCNYSTGTHP